MRSFRKFTTRTVVVGGLLAAFGSANAAFAAPVGFNDAVNQVRATGSDTTYYVMQRIADLYNGSPGCSLDPASSFQTCASTQPTGVVTSEDYDHDEVQNAYPTGSGNGIKAVCGTLGGTGTLPVDFARSSKDAVTGDCAGLTNQAYARDAIDPIVFPNVASSATQGSPAAGCKPGEAAGSCSGANVTGIGTGALPQGLTKQNLTDIFVNCTVTDWGQLTNGGTPGATPPTYGTATGQKIVVWGIQTNSGTYGVFKNFVGGDPNSCVTSSGGQIIFENDAQPIASAGADVQSRSIYWMSNGRFNVAPFTRANGSNTKVNGVRAVSSTITSTPPTYPITRNLNNVYKTSGASQATAAFMNWICQPSHTIDPETNRNYASEIGSAVGQSGFFAQACTFTTT